MANWERKSAYLLREIVKFRTYIDGLQAAQAQKEKIYAERPVSGHKPHTLEDPPLAQSSDTSLQDIELQQSLPVTVAGAET